MFDDGKDEGRSVSVRTLPNRLPQMHTRDGAEVPLHSYSVVSLYFPSDHVDSIVVSCDGTVDALFCLNGRIHRLPNVTPPLQLSTHKIRAPLRCLHMRICEVATRTLWRGWGVMLAGPHLQAIRGCRCFALPKKQKNIA